VLNLGVFNLIYRHAVYAHCADFEFGGLASDL
jgi:hypothetical protein